MEPDIAYFFDRRGSGSTAGYSFTLPKTSPSM